MLGKRTRQLRMATRPREGLLMFLLSGSGSNLETRSSSASTLADDRTFVMSSVGGEAVPLRARRRYAARCFISAPDNQRQGKVTGSVFT